MIEGPQNVSAPLGFNRSVSCRGNGNIVWVFNGIQIRSADRIENFRTIGVYTNVGQVNESTTAIIASEMTNNYNIECRVEQGNIVNGLTFHRSPVAVFTVFGKNLFLLPNFLLICLSLFVIDYFQLEIEGCHFNCLFILVPDIFFVI